MCNRFTFWRLNQKNHRPSRIFPLSFTPQSHLSPRLHNFPGSRWSQMYVSPFLSYASSQSRITEVQEVFGINHDADIRLFGDHRPVRQREARTPRAPRRAKPSDPSPGAKSKVRPGRCHIYPFRSPSFLGGTVGCFSRQESVQTMKDCGSRYSKLGTLPAPSTGNFQSARAQGPSTPHPFVF